MAQHPEPRRHHKPLARADSFFADLVGGADPALVSEAADRAAHLLVRGARGTDDPAVADRLLHLAETEGIETIAEVWSGSPADSLAGCLWRLFVLRSWVHADPLQVAREYEAGLGRAQVAQVVAGVADPPGPEQLRTMVDEVLRGLAESDLADVLFRAAAFARVLAAGRAALPHTDTRATPATLTGSPAPGADGGVQRMLLLSEQLEAAGHLELAHALS